VIDEGAVSPPSESADEVWREPSMTEAFVDGYTLRIPGTRSDVRVRTVLRTVLAASIAALLLPSLRNFGGFSTPVAVVAIVIAIQAYRAAQLQQRLGRPSSRPIAAAGGLIAAALIAVVPFVVVSWLFGPAPGDAPLYIATRAVIERVGVLGFFVGFLVALWLVAVVIQRRGRSRVQNREAEIEAAIRRERDARARATGTLTRAS
jgi:hypothetical protein